MDDGGDVQATANAFSVSIAQAFAKIISEHYGSVFVDGELGNACSFTKSTGSATANAIASATSKAFAQSSNAFAKAAAGCTASAVSIESILVTQDVSFSTCVDTESESDFFFKKVETTGFVQAIATTFSNVFTAIKDNNLLAAATCVASAVSNTGVIVNTSSG